MDGLDVELEGRVPAEHALAKLTLKWFQFHVDALCVVLQVRDRLECLPTAFIGALERSDVC